MLILASKSPTRQALLRGAGLDFEVEVSAVDERQIEEPAKRAGADGRDVAQLLAEAKARSVSARRREDLVIGADQTLSLGTELFHKPETHAAAAEQLDRLRGKTHRLHAAVSLARGGEVIWTDVQSAELTMRAFSSAERDQILALEGLDAAGSVGGYRLEGPSIRLFEAINGDYFTILGLPLLPLLAALRAFAPDLLGGSAP